jgi:3-methyladenine DNA glycosylase AlkD
MKKQVATKRKSASPETEMKSVIATLKRLSSKKTLDGMARYGLPSDNALGVSVGAIQKVAKDLGRNHELAESLWTTGIYEARLLSAFVGEPQKVTSAQMDRWCRDFDNWGVVDTVCFKLFDQTPHAWKKVEQWAKRKDEFQKRAGYVLLACLCGHDKKATNEQFLRCLPLIEEASTDGRNFVKKGVSWALRGIGRRNLELNKAATELSQRLSNSSDATARWLGKEGLKEFARPVVVRQLEKKAKEAQAKATKEPSLISDC